MTVDIYQKHQETVEAAANMLCKLKQRYQLNKGHGDMVITYVEEVSHGSSYLLLEYMSFDSDISKGVAKIM